MKMITVTKPFLPPLSEYVNYLEQIWDSNWLTNNGPLVNELELKLKEFLNVDHLLFVTNGTTALQLAINALSLSGEVITTPFSYIATTSSILWEGCTPVFADIDPDTLNIDPLTIEELITPRTSAIIATHTFGNPCEIDAIQSIAERYQLKVIYDAAHCFGVKYKGESIYRYGDISIASFHSTKLFHTIEGGAVFTNNAELLRRMVYMRNFGHNGPIDYAEIGINGKNSEFHAAMGLINLKYVPYIMEKRKNIFYSYMRWLEEIDGHTIRINEHGEFNYAYFPLIFETEQALLEACQKMEDKWIFPRRYFYPGLNKLRFVKPQTLPVCDDLSKRVLCLPVFDTLTTEQIDYTCELIVCSQKISSLAPSKILVS